MAFIGRLGTQDIVVPAGQSVAVGCYGDGSAKVFYGYASGGVLPTYTQQSTVTNGQATFGPFSTQQFVRLEAPAGASVEYVVGSSPQLTQTPLSRVPYALAQTGVPFILPSNGSSNASGQITFTTALPYVPSGKPRVYLPAGVVTAGSQGSGAGWYEATFSSTTVCQLTGTGIVTANAAYTQTSAEVQAVSISIPGGAMGPNGALRSRFIYSVPNNANGKFAHTRFGGSLIIDIGNASQSGFAVEGSIFNRGQQGAQISTGSAFFGNATVAAAIDTSVTQAFTVGINVAVATDYMILEGYTVEIIPAN